MNRAKQNMSDAAIIITEHDPVGSFNIHRNLAATESYWHKILVYDTYNLNRNIILRSIMNFVEPSDFVPFKYETFDNSASFMVNNCCEALQKLCAGSLIIQNLEDCSKYFKLGIILAYSAADQSIRNILSTNTQSVITKRYNSVNTTLNLDNFHNDPEHLEYTPLSQKRLLKFALSLCKPHHITTLKLSNNEIKWLPPEFFTIFNHVTILDLRNNCLESVDDIMVCSNCPITEIMLEGNPLCNNYDHSEYIKAVKKIFPKLDKLDGFSGEGTLPFRRNFLCNLSGQDLVDQFLEHYYLFYDTPGQRHLLANLYHEQAFFSLTKQHIGGQISTPTANLTPYQNFARNLKFMADFSKGGGNLWFGNGTITNILEQFPSCEHDPFTFTVDLVYYTEKMAVFMVTGVFRELPNNLNDKDRYCGFTRTFVLAAVENSNEYLILNDQLHINNALTNQEQRAFKQTQVPKSNYLEIPTAVLQKEQNELIYAFRKLTTLNAMWAKKCLEECKYDFKEALHHFMDLYRTEKIPQDVFEKLEETVKTPAIQEVSSLKEDRGEYSTPADIRYSEVQKKYKILRNEKQNEQVSRIQGSSTNKKQNKLVSRIPGDSTNEQKVIWVPGGEQKKIKVSKALRKQDVRENGKNSETIKSAIAFQQLVDELDVLVSKTDEPDFKKEDHISKTLSTINKILKFPKYKFRHHYLYIYTACDKYDLPETRQFVKTQEEIAMSEQMNMLDYGGTCFQVIKLKYNKKIQKRFQHFMSKLYRFLATPLYHDYFEFREIYDVCDRIRIPQLTMILKGYERHTIEVIKYNLNNISTNSNPDRYIRSLLVVLKSFSDNGVKLDMDVWIAMYFANMRLLGKEMPDALLESAEWALTPEDYFKFEDYLIDDTIRNKKAKSKIFLFMLRRIRYRLYHHPEQYRRFVKYLLILKEVCKTTSRLIFCKGLISERNADKRRAMETNYKHFTKLENINFIPGDEVYLMIEGYFKEEIKSNDICEELSKIFPDTILQVQQLQNASPAVYRMQLKNREAWAGIIHSKDTPKNMMFYRYIRKSSYEFV